ncbi:organic cation transporter protein isoform X2 [Agrilus planipennis]|uniref:Organic cation transporter protein isoform X2 n=1 Tax=Agrilus planipennis TaxID=224129 RepID=A0A1W4XE31_AGRPL|nr:organic cation transporter protein isoform X2 [Agrilus planipennis]
MTTSNDHPLDTVLVEVGEFGKFQFFSFTLICLGIVLHSGVNVAFAFTAMDLNYRCFIPNCDSETIQDFNPSWLTNVVPYKDSDTPSKCEKYVVVQPSNVTNSISCSELSFNRSLTETCSSYVFETEEKSILQDFDLYCDNKVWMLTLVGTINTFGVFFGVSISGVLSDRFGRKNVLVAGLVFCSICGIIRAFVNSYLLFLLFEFLDAAFGSGAYPISFILAVELVGPSKRVFTGTLICSSFAIGEILTASVAWAVQSWRPLILILYSPILLTVFYYWLIPESVRWLLSQKRYDDAKAILRKAATVNGRTISDETLEKLCEASEANNSNSKNEKVSKKLLYEFFKSKTLTLRLLNCCFCWITCAFSFYGLTLNSVSLAGNSYVDFMLSAIVEIPAYLAVYLLVDRLGRRFSLCSSFFITGISCLGVVFIPSSLYSLQLPVYLLGKFGSTAAFAVSYVVTSELFPTPLRSSLVTTSSMVGRVGNVLAPQAPLLAQIWSPLPLTLFAVFGFASSITSIFFPETLYTKLPDTIHEAELLGKKQKANQ